MKTKLINDPHFRVEVIAKTERPNLVSYLALHQCYVENATMDDYGKFVLLSDDELGRRVVDKCVKFGHYSVLEHSNITLNVIGFPHDVMAQATRHRHISFSVQSQRYTGDRILKLGNELCNKTQGDKLLRETAINIEKVFYRRPKGKYQDREGNNYEYNDFEFWLNHCIKACLDYKELADKGYSPEHIRQFIPQNVRQDFVMTLNARSLMHFCDLRLPADAQLEIRTLANMMLDIFKTWMPECAEWYIKNRAEKNKLAP